jgi:glycosyltransferase involved in cell wall biosynthesis
MPEVVGDAGILVSPYHEDEWVSAMLTMLKLNQEDRARLSHSASERSRVFSWDKTAATTLDAYNAIFLKRTKL